MNMKKNPDMDILKAYLRLPYPSFARKLNLRYELDYPNSLVIYAIKGTKKIPYPIENFVDDETYEKIREYVTKSNCIEDKIYLSLTETIYHILLKYYNPDGTAKK
ncbi:MAG: hypothetical protein HFI08_01240 [Bacilli bacterium]|jgi:hypothetical protein|nr:hypothetical protein [Bacilli bacterium]